MSLLADLGDCLSSGSTGIVGTDIFLGRLSDTPAAQIAITEYGGFAPVHAWNSGPGNAVLERPRVQLSSRAETYTAAKSRIKEMEHLLDGLRDRTINGTTYHFVQAVQPAFLLEYDANNRPILAQNFDVSKAWSTG